MEQVMAVKDFADQVQAGLRRVLADIGETAATGLPWVKWHVEFPKSRVYDLVGLLVFTSYRDPETELVVVTVHHRGCRGWTIDVTDRESLALVDDLALQQQCENIAATDAGKTVEDIRAILGPITERIVRELAP